MSIDNDNMKLWIAALRSGEFEQTTGCLHNQLGYCCLGVACEIAIRNGVQLETAVVPYLRPVETPTFTEFRTSYNGEDSYLPTAVRDWLGLHPGIWNQEDGITQETLVRMNDEGTSFERIADWLEGHDLYFEQ